MAAYAHTTSNFGILKLLSQIWNGVVIECSSNRTTLHIEAVIATVLRFIYIQVTTSTNIFYSGIVNFLFTHHHIS